MLLALTIAPIKPGKRISIFAQRDVLCISTTQSVSQTALGRAGQVDDISTIATFLASEDSKWLTGELILASGGLR